MLKTTDYACVIQNDTAFASCIISVNNKNCKYLVKSDEGWQIITTKVFGNPYFYKEFDDDNYTLCIREYKGKYMIYFMQRQKDIDKNGKKDLKDSLGSHFEEFRFTQVYEYNFWYWCLDDIPEYYTISVGDEVIYGKEKSGYNSLSMENNP